jgi:hypothetical protein
MSSLSVMTPAVDDARRRDPSAVVDDLMGCLGVSQWAGIAQPAGYVRVDDDVREPSSVDHASVSTA